MRTRAMPNAEAHEAPEIIDVLDRSVSCDGGGGALGHPKVWLNMGSDSFVECPYCDRRFELAAGARPDGH